MFKNQMQIVALVTLLIGYSLGSPVNQNYIEQTAEKAEANKPQPEVISQVKQAPDTYYTSTSYISEPKVEAQPAAAILPVSVEPQQPQQQQAVEQVYASKPVTTYQTTLLRSQPVAYPTVYKYAAPQYTYAQQSYQLPVAQQPLQIAYPYQQQYQQPLQQVYYTQQAQPQAHFPIQTLPEVQQVQTVQQPVTYVQPAPQVTYVHQPQQVEYNVQPVAPVEPVTTYVHSPQPNLVAEQPAATYTQTANLPVQKKEVVVEEVQTEQPKAESEVKFSFGSTNVKRFGTKF